MTTISDSSTVCILDNKLEVLTHCSLRLLVMMMSQIVLAVLYETMTLDHLMILACNSVVEILKIPTRLLRELYQQLEETREGLRKEEKQNQIQSVYVSYYCISAPSLPLSLSPPSLL